MRTFVSRYLPIFAYLLMTEEEVAPDEDDEEDEEDDSDDDGECMYHHIVVSSTISKSYTFTWYLSIIFQQTMMTTLVLTSR